MRHNLNDYFSESELRELCFDLDVPFEDLDGRNKRDKALALIKYLERRGRLSELIALCRDLRPNVEWLDLPGASAADRSLSSDQATSTNPFTYGNPISEPGRFFGRHREVEQVFSRLTNPEHESTSLVGSRRIGKTSLLKYLANPEVRRQYGLDPDRYVVIYIDLQMLEASTTANRLWRRLLGQVARYCRDPEVKFIVRDLRESGAIDNFALADVFDAIDASGQHLVLLLDEFENVTSNENFDAGFFYGLRSLAIQHNLSLVTSSGQELIELTHSETIRSSPFFNIFANINVSVFTEAETRELIDHTLAGTRVRFSEADIVDLLEIAGTYPFFVQAAAFFLFRAYAKGLDPDGRAAYLTAKFRPEAAPHLSHFWQESNQHEQIVFLVLALLNHSRVNASRQAIPLARINRAYGRAEQTLNRLTRRALVSAFSGGYALFNQTFGEWIVDEIANPADDQQGFATWSQTNVGLIERLEEPVQERVGNLLPLVADRYRNLIMIWLANCSNVNAAAGLLEQVIS